MLHINISIMIMYKLSLVLLGLSSGHATQLVYSITEKTVGWQLNHGNPFQMFLDNLAVLSHLAGAI